MLNQELKEKLLKLYELSKRGIGGEKTNAETFLQKLLDKHGLTIDDIDANVKKERFYKYTTKANKSIILQVIFSILGEKGSLYSNKSYKEVITDATDYENIQIIEKIDFHLENFEADRKQILNDFKSAYIQKHRLFPMDNGDTDEECKPLTPEERAAIMRAAHLQTVLNNNTYTKKLD